MIACYRDYWRDIYQGAAFSRTSDREVLVVRAINAHHWTPGIATSLSNYALGLSLIDELAVFKLTEMAIHVCYMDLQDLLKADYQALMGRTNNK